MRDYELRVHVLKDPRSGNKLYFKGGKEAHRVEEACMMVYVGRELFHTGYPMPHIEDWRPNMELTRFAERRVRHGGSDVYSICN